MGKKTKKKIDVKGRSAGGSEHTSEKRPSTTGKHQESRATKRKSYGGEKGDDGRRYPRKRPKEWLGPWPPPEETESQPNLDTDAEGPEGKAIVSAAPDQPQSGTDEHRQNQEGNK